VQTSEKPGALTDTGSQTSSGSAAPGMARAQGTCAVTSDWHDVRRGSRPGDAEGHLPLSRPGKEVAQRSWWGAHVLAGSEPTTAGPLDPPQAAGHCPVRRSSCASLVQLVRVKTS